MSAKKSSKTKRKEEGPVVSSDKHLVIGVCAWTDLAKAKETRAVIERTCKEVALPAPLFETDYLRALANARLARQRHQDVTIVAEFKDWTPPNNLPNEFVEWLEVFRSETEHLGIAVLPIDPVFYAKPYKEYGSAVKLQIIQAYEKLRKDLKGLLNEYQTKGRTGYVCGRPFYGYRVVEGRLKIIPEQAEVVKTILEGIDRKMGKRQVAALVREKHPNLEKYDMHWHMRLIGRVQKYRELYTRGVYRNSVGNVSQHDDLVIRADRMPRTPDLVGASSDNN